MKNKILFLIYLISFLFYKFFLSFTKIITNKETKVKRLNLYNIYENKNKNKKIVLNRSRYKFLITPFTKIDNNVYLGNIVQASNINLLKTSKITHIFNITNDIPNYFPYTVEYINIKIKDDGIETFSKEDFLYIKNKFNSILLNKNNKIFIHCFAGCSRSVIITCLYIMNAYNLDLNNALYYIYKKRNIIKPSEILYINLLNYKSNLN